MLGRNPCELISAAHDESMETSNVEISKKKVAVLTPCVGTPFLKENIASVSRQTYQNLVHVLVIDGPERRDSVLCQVPDSSKIQVIQLPYVTGARGFQGHRIYAAIPILLDFDYICYLDEDNWFEADHVSSLLKLCEQENLDWAYSLRKIIRRDGAFLCNDDCNSLGRWPSYDGGYHHVDTSCYFLPRRIAVRITDAWNRSDEEGRGAADRIVYRVLSENYPLFHTTGAYTLNYRLASRKSEAGDIRFYCWGNRVHERLYRIYPWRHFEAGPKCKLHPHIDYKVSVATEAFLGGPLYATPEMEAGYAAKAATAKAGK